MSAPIVRYFIRVQLVEQSGFDEDSAQVTVMSSEVITTPVFRKSRAELQFSQVKSLIDVADQFDSGAG